MSIVVNIEPRIHKVDITEDSITAHLEDGRTISVPLAWSWRLSEATKKQRENYTIIGEGTGVHWPEIDEDLSARGMLSGVPANKPKRIKKKTA